MWSTLSCNDCRHDSGVASRYIALHGRRRSCAPPRTPSTSTCRRISTWKSRHLLPRQRRTPELPSPWRRCGSIWYLTATTRSDRSRCGSSRWSPSTETLSWTASSSRARPRCCWAGRGACLASCRGWAASRPPPAMHLWPRASSPRPRPRGPAWCCPAWRPPATGETGPCSALPSYPLTVPLQALLLPPHLPATADLPTADLSTADLPAAAAPHHHQLLEVRELLQPGQAAPHGPGRALPRQARVEVGTL